MTTDKLDDETLARLIESASAAMAIYDSRLVTAEPKTILTLTEELLRLRAGVARAKELRNKWALGDFQSKAMTVDEILEGFEP